MSIKQLTVQPKLSDEETEALAGEFITYDKDRTKDKLIEPEFIVDCDVDMYKENGEPLVLFRKRQVPERHASTALKALYHAATEYGNRGVAAGKLKYHN